MDSGTENLKKETVKGVVWSAVEKFSTGGVLFLANIILARLLSPRDFGLLAIISIFVQISQTFIDSGFSNALIQKKDGIRLIIAQSFSLISPYPLDFIYYCIFLPRSLQNFSRMNS